MIGNGEHHVFSYNTSAEDRTEVDGEDIVLDEVYDSGVYDVSLLAIERMSFKCYFVK